MSDDMIALSRRAVACKRWRWMPGTLRLRATPTWSRDHLRMEGRAPDGGDTWDYAAWPVIPDLTDAATLGCLLALVREAYSEDRTWVRWWAPEGCAYSAHPLDDWKQPDALFTSEAEALVAALEGAP